MFVKLNFWLDSIQNSKLLCPFQYTCIISSSVGPKLRSHESTILPHATPSRRVSSIRQVRNVPTTNMLPAKNDTVRVPPELGTSVALNAGLLAASSMVLSKAILYVEP
ncbi:hypothetical protein B0H14DRAFT_2589103 [Mycena olivaceomarginata]|nr:hypothetical protein B0H14DRAFT_2589103 [Mycena olivaceomarginata]